MEQDFTYVIILLIFLIAIIMDQFSQNVSKRRKQQRYDEYKRNVQKLKINK